MALARWQSTITDLAGNVLPAALITVRREAAGAPLAVLYQDRDGTLPLGNPFPADADGFAACFTDGGPLRIDVASGPFARTLRYVPAGLASEFDIVLPEVPAAGALVASDGSAGNIGALTGAELAPGDDLSAITETCIVAATATTANTPIAGQAFMVVTLRRDAGNASQIAQHLASSATYTRRRIADVWGGWTRLLTGADAATEAEPGALDLATDAEIRAAAPGAHAITAQDLETAAAFVTLTETGGAVALDWDGFINARVTIDQNTVIGNPANGQPGTWRILLVSGNDATFRTITFGTQFFGEIPTITDCNNGRTYMLMMFCASPTWFAVSAKRI